MAGSGVAPGGAWQPEFPGQRPPFERGNLTGMRHGAFSKRLTGPRAAELVAELLASPGTPSYLKEDPSYADGIQAWAESRAEVERLRAYRDAVEEQLSADDAVDQYLTDTTSVSESEVRPALGALQRESLTRQQESLSRALHRAEMRLRTLRNDLGLSPSARSKMGREVTRPRFDLAAYWAQRWEEEEAEQVRNESAAQLPS